MRPDEMMVDITFPALKRNQRGMFIKLGLRRAQAISLVDAAVVLDFSEENDDGPAARRIEGAAITLGAVAPRIVHAEEAESFLVGRRLDEETIEAAARLAMEQAQPIDDVRSSKEYRSEMVRISVLRCLRSLARGEERGHLPDHPVLLWGNPAGRNIPRHPERAYHERGSEILTRINGRGYRFKGGMEKTLLRLLREEAGLIGTKEGCAEGECGACTVFLDGEAVMSCLVPAARAHGAEIVTIEGLSQNGRLHPVQQAFIEAGAVQCGYCTPGFLMSAAKLLEERPVPTKIEIEQAITGNLCRCTGYYKIVEAIERAAHMTSPKGVE
jgi:carbon-monoxide dehydrogenase medium subunit